MLSSTFNRLVIGGGVLVFAIIILGLVLPGDETTRPAAVPEATRTESAQASKPKVRYAVPSYVSVNVNPSYDRISTVTAEQAVGEVAHWYENRHGLKAEISSTILIEPECITAWQGGVLGYAKPITDGQKVTTIEVCVRLDADDPVELASPEFRWLLAHEYFHVLQANAGWALEGGCGRFFSEGSAEYFGQMYGFGKLADDSLLDLLTTLLTLDVERWYYYDVGARAFAALVRAHGRQAITFWESEEERCADEFLARFDITPARWEEDWENR